MSLVLQLLLEILQLVLDGRKQTSRMLVTPLNDMLDTAFGALAPAEVLEQVARCLQVYHPQLHPAAALDALALAVSDAATRDWLVQDRLEQVLTALEELRTSINTIQSLSGMIELQLKTPLAFQFLQYLVLSEPGEQPVVLLVGAVPRADGLVQLPQILDGLLSQVQIIYRGTELYPLFKTELWARFPPNPVRQRLQTWTPSRLDGEGQLELYRRQMPGEGPWGVITSERITNPHHLASANVDLLLTPSEPSLNTVRTTIRDKFKQPLLITERVLAVV